ncbi:MAG: hypothetical protein IJ852_06835 [Alphaproteobacteria bacterium]|nr:hypothetical protein [Alphaproteobacteria bacterium]
MAENNTETQNQSNKPTAEEVYTLLASANPDMDKIRGLLADHPDIITDPELLDKIFPDRQKKDIIDEAGILSPEGLNNIISNLGKADPAALQKFADAEIYRHEDRSYSLAETLEYFRSAAQQKLDTNKDSLQPVFTDEKRKKMEANMEMYTTALHSLQQALASQKEEELTVGSTKPGALKVKEKTKPQVPEEKPQKIANIAPQGDSANGEEDKYEKPKWDTIKEKDIIDFMYDDIFLAGVDWGLKTPYMMIDKMLAKKAQRKAHEKAILNKANQSTNDSQIDAARQRCLAVLKLPEKKRAEFAANQAQHMAYADALRDDIEKNAPLSPKEQQWTVVNDPKRQKFYTDLYQRDPQEFADHLNKAFAHPSENHRAMESIYHLAAKRAAVDWVDAKLKKGKWKFAEKPIDKSEKEVEKRTMAYFKQIMDERSLARQMAHDMCDIEGITDPKEIAERERKYDEAYLKHLTESVMEAHDKLELDVCEPNTYKNKTRANDSDKAIQAVENIHENAEELASQLYQKDHPATHAVESLKDFAHSVVSRGENRTPDNLVMARGILENARTGNSKRKKDFMARIQAMQSSNNKLAHKFYEADRKGRS